VYQDGEVPAELRFLSRDPDLDGRAFLNAMFQDAEVHLGFRGTMDDPTENQGRDPLGVVGVEERA
jgi:hypothetical protein